MPTAVARSLQAAIAKANEDYDVQKGFVQELAGTPNAVILSSAMHVDISASGSGESKERLAEARRIL